MITRRVAPIRRARRCLVSGPPRLVRENTPKQLINFSIFNVAVFSRFRFVCDAGIPGVEVIEIRWSVAREKP